MDTGIVITVRYVGPTNHRGSRWIARADHPIGRVVVPYSYETHSGLDNARIAADAMVARWSADWTAQHPGVPYPYAIVAGGHTADGYAFVVAIRRAVVITLGRANGLPLIIADDGRDILVQTDWDYPGVASSFGWSVRSVRPTLAHAPADCEHIGTDGTVGCETCGLTPSQFIADASAYLDDNIGRTAEDPGYFGDAS